jgi:aerobic-type carbon monoxide dehydrogenase small subunit (CoxS/CutS family)
MTSGASQSGADLERPPNTVTVELHVNGQRHRCDVRPTETLLETVRNQLKLYGAREGCGVGMCGACTVLVDSRPVSSCLLLTFLADGRHITTVEGLEQAGELHPVQEAFIRHTGFQCSYCTPGFILSVVALLDENPEPTIDEARRYLAGNLCRCGSYVKILDAVMHVKPPSCSSRESS